MKHALERSITSKEILTGVIETNSSMYQNAVPTATGPISLNGIAPRARVIAFRYILQEYDVDMG